MENTNSKPDNYNVDEMLSAFYDGYYQQKRQAETEINSLKDALQTSIGIAGSIIYDIKEEGCDIVTDNRAAILKKLFKLTKRKENENETRNN